MRTMLSLMSCVVFLFFCQVGSNFNAEARRTPPPFRVSWGISGAKLKDFKPGQSFSINLKVSAYSDPLYNIKVEIIVPNEVAVLEGCTGWTGDLSPNSEKYCGAVLRATKYPTEWTSTPVGHVEFVHKNTRYRRDITWKLEGYDASDYIIMEKLPGPKRK